LRGIASNITTAEPNKADACVFLSQLSDSRMTAGRTGQTKTPEIIRTCKGEVEVGDRTLDVAAMSTWLVDSSPQGTPAQSFPVVFIIQPIAATMTKTGLKVRCELDRNTYPAGIKVSDADMAAVNLSRHDFHGE
jgi:hypothetical protein